MLNISPQIAAKQDDITLAEPLAEWQKAPVVETAPAEEWQKAPIVDSVGTPEPQDEVARNAQLDREAAIKSQFTYEDFYNARTTLKPKHTFGKTASLLADRVSDGLWNNTIGGMVAAITGRDSSFVRDEAYHLVDTYQRENNISLQDAQYDDLVNLYSEQLMLPPEQRDSSLNLPGLANQPQMTPFKDVESVLGPRPMSTETSDLAGGWVDGAIDFVTGTIAFVTKFKGLQKAMPTAPAWTVGEAVSIANGGKPGQVAPIFGAMSMFEKALLDPRMIARFGTGVVPKLGAGAGAAAVMGGSTALAGGTAQEITFNAAFPFVLSYIGVTKANWDAAKPKTKAQAAIEFRNAVPEELQNKSRAEIIDSISAKLGELDAQRPTSPATAKEGVGSTKTPTEGQTQATEALVKPESPISQEGVVELQQATAKIPSGLLKPVNVTGEKVGSKLAESIEENAILKGLIGEEGIADLPQHFVANMKKQAKAAANIPPDEARRIVAGEIANRDGVLDNAVLIAVENRALKNGDVETITALAHSPLIEQTTRVAQELRMLRERTKYSPVGVVQDVVAARNTIPEPKLVKDVSKAKTQLEKAEQKLAQKELDNTIARVKAPKAQPKADPKSSTYGSRNRVVTKEAADAAMKRLGERGTFKAGIDPKNLKDVLEISTYHLEAIGRNIGEWTRVLTEQFGDVIKPHLQDLWKKSNAVLSTTEKKALVASLKNSFEKGKTLTDQTGTIRQLQENLIRSGFDKRGTLLRQMHKILKGIDKTITERDAMDAMSGSGKFKLLDKDEIKAKRRDINAQYQNVAKLQDMEKGQAPPKTGYERQKPSDETRRLIQQVEEAKKKGGYNVTDPVKQLQTAIGEIKTRLTNRIADLKAQIESGKKTIKTKSPQPSDAETIRLTAEKDRLQKDFDDLFGKNELTDQQRINIATASLEKSITEYERRIAENDLAPAKKGTKTPSTPKLEALKARRDALKEEVQNLKDLANPPKDPEQVRTRAAQNAIEKSIAELEERLKTGNLAPKEKGKPVQDTPELKAVRGKLFNLRTELERLRKEANPPKTPEQIALQSYKTRLANERANLEERIANEDFARPEKTERVSDIDTDTLRYARDKAKRVVQTAQEVLDQKGGISKEEVTNIVNLSQKIEEAQLAAKDPANKQAHIDLGNAILDLYDYQQTLVPKTHTWRSVTLDVAGVPQALMTSLDFSFPFRQGWGSMSTKEFWEGFGEQFKYAWSETNLRNLQAEIHGSPRYDMAKKAGLRLTDLTKAGEWSNAPGRNKTDSLYLQGREEGMQTTLADHIPIVGRYVRASQRAYTGMANYIRWNRFNNMVDSAILQGRDVKPGSQTARDIANVVNIFTGSGNIGKADRYGNISPLANQVLFSIRKLSGDLNMIDPRNYIGVGKYTKLDPFARAMAQRQLLGSLGMTGAILGLAAMAGLEVELDPRSKIFGKIKIGNRVIDISGGKITLLVFLTQSGLSAANVFLSQPIKETKSASGKLIKLDKDEPLSKTTEDVYEKFTRGKLAPMASLFADVFKYKEDFQGEPVKTPQQIAGAVAQRFIPMSIGDTVSMFEDDVYGDVFANTALNLFLGTLMTFGNTVTVYDKK
jgi:hypothetical protein